MEPAPFGRGSETVVDASIRSTMQLDPSCFILDDSWTTLMQPALAEAAATLAGGDPSVRAELHKLVVYRPGDFFKAHRDTPRGNGLFGTMSITLPSAHIGGALVVRHAGEEVHIDSSPATEPSACAWAAWFAATEHEVLPLETGHRIALLYNLYRDPTRVASISLANAAPEIGYMAALRRLKTAYDQGALEKIDPTPDINLEAFRRPMGIGRLGYLLEHKYAANLVTVPNLNGNDALLHQILEKAGLDVTVAPVEVRYNASSYSWDFGDWYAEYLRMEISELDPSKKIKANVRSRPMAARTAFASRELKDVRWMHDLEGSVAKATKTDCKTHELGNEGTEFHESYVYSALFVNFAPNASPFTEAHSARNWQHII
jgi:hypothetical protein